MVRKRIEIKKIEKIAARQVTFSKRRRGLFKKADELSTLCDAQIALLVFSSTAKLFHFSTSSRMMEVIQRYKKHTGEVGKPENSSLAVQLGNSNYIMLSKELDGKTRELSRLKGEELEDLDIEELSKLEREIERAQARLRQIKERLLTGENEKLKIKVNNAARKHGPCQILMQHDLDNSMNHNHCSSSPSKDNMIFDTALRLGLPVRGIE